MKFRLTSYFLPLTSKSSGFTLIELLVVMGLIAILATVVIVAVNPTRQFAAARDTQRRADLYALTSVLVQYQIDNNGRLPDQDNFPILGTCIGNTSPCFNLAAFLVPTYLPDIPKDPSIGTISNTQYFVYRDADHKIIATASGEIAPTITVIR